MVNSDKLQIVTFNVKGIKDYYKRMKLFKWCSKKKFDIICLQETHCEKETIEDWKREWKGDIIASYGTHNSRGTCILLRENLEYEITSQKVHKFGRYVAIELKVGNAQYKIASYYGPNNDDPVVLTELIEIIRNMEGENTILCGDFNLLMDLTLDKKGGNQTTNFKCSSTLKEWMEEENLYDVWRVIHPDAKTYTWRSNHKPPIFCRLDFFIVSAKVLGETTKCYIGPGLNSDHSYVSLNIKSNINVRGRGFWKFSKHLLDNENFVRNIVNVIQTTSRDNAGCNDCLMWDTIKSSIRGECIKFNSKLKKEDRNLLSKAEKELAELQSTLSQISSEYNVNSQEIRDLDNNINIKKDVINELLDKECKGEILRSKLQYYEEGDKPSKFFLGLERSRAANKTINKLVTNNGSTITDPKEILSEQCRFYKNLYKSSLNALDPERIEDRNIVLENMLKSPSPKVNRTQQHELIRPVTEQEIWNIIKNSVKNKSPGTDGLTNEFYIKFWPHVKEYVMKAYDHSLNTGQLSINQRQGIISVIPKGNKDTTRLKNWRPITLLNQDYKYLAKCLADRCKNILPSIINYDQSGFVPGRVIGSNIIRVQDLINQCRETNTKALLMCIDYEKAFDSIEWCFVFRALEYFNFPKQYIEWIKTFYNNINTCTINNGNISEFFNPERGVRQGCPLSPILFVISVELLAIEVRKNGKIRGIKGKLGEHKISQFADDTTFFLHNSKDTIDELYKTLADFTIVSGLRLNQDKTEVLPLGSATQNECPTLLRPHIKDKVKLLGVTITLDKASTVEVNFNQVIEKMSNLMQLWSKRNLSLAGRICVLKSLIISKLIYNVICLPSPGGAKLKEIQNLFYSFVWNNKPERIPRKVLIGNYENGGYRMPDITIQTNALKCVWIKNMVNMEGKWRDYIINLIPMNCPHYFSRCNIKYADIPNKPCKNSIWSDILINWCCFNFVKYENIQNKEDIMNQNLWWNSNIKINKKVVFLQRWADKNIRYISDLCDEEGKLLNHRDFTAKFDIVTPFTTFLGLLSAIPRSWRRLLYIADVTVEEGTYEALIDQLDKSQRASNLIYNKSVKDRSEKPFTILDRWKIELGMEINQNDWLKYLTNMRYFIECNRTRSFLYKFHLRDIPYGKRLFKMGKSENDKCKWCTNVAESISHLYWHCPKSVELWKAVATLFNDLYNLNEDLNNLDPLKYLFGIEKPNRNYPRVLDIVNALTRNYIHIDKCKEAGNRSIIGLENYIKSIMVKEWQVALKRGKQYMYINKWDKLFDPPIPGHM